MDRRKLLVPLVALLVVLAAVLGLAAVRTGDAEGEDKTEVAAAGEERMQEVCASSATYARLKEVAFEEAQRIRAADPANLDTLAASSVVRMEEPVVESRDDELNVTVCRGRFVLELPPGAEAAFGGERRLVAEIEYAAQAAADGSGLVYRMSGAESLISRLAAFDLQGRRLPQPAEQETEFAEAAPLPEPLEQAELLDQAPPPTVPDRRDVPPEPAPAPPPSARPRAEAPPSPAGSSNPSFNCRYARSRSERMVCASNRLAARDRAMSSQFYSALADADSRTRRELRRSRDRFLAYRDRCGSEECVAQAYEDRMAEISDIMAARDD